MNAKPIIAFFLAFFVAASVAYMFVKSPGLEREVASGESEVFAVVEGVEPELIVYYFYNNIRCATCSHLEAYTREALETHFAEEVAAGVIQWRMLSMDDPTNEHYLIDYELYSKSVVLARMRGGEELHFANLEGIWDLVYDKADYLEYIRENVQEFLGAAP